MGDVRRIGCAIVAALSMMVFAPGALARSLEEDLRSTTQSMLDAVAPGNASVWDTQLHRDFIHMDEAGVVRTREELLREFTPLPAGLVGRIEIDTYRVVVHGDVAVAAYEIQEYLDYFGQPLRSRFRSMDTWRRTREGWRLIAQHTAAVLKDPPAVHLTQAQFCEYAGVYALTAEIETTIRCSDAGLEAVRTGRPNLTYNAETRDVFFAPGQPRTRRIFVRGEDGAILGFVDRREGEDVRWRLRSGATP